MVFFATISQTARRSAITKRNLARTYHATPAARFTKNNVQKQEEIPQNYGSESSTVYVSHEGSDYDPTFKPVVNNVFDE